MSNDVMIVFLILFAAVIMFSTEKIRNDVASIIIMLSLAWTGVIPVNSAFAGFSSNAVISIMGVMIIGYSIEKTGIMDSLALVIMKKIGTKENVIVATVMIVTGAISSFMQNIGAVALFLPAVKKIGNKSRISPQRLIMPLAFSGILGGTLTMVASGPLIILNDLLTESGYEGYELFSVSPIGLGLLVAGVLFFFFFSKFVLPSESEETELRKDDLTRLNESKDFVVITQIKPPADNSRADKKVHAMVILVITIVMILMGVPLPLGFLTSAILMLFAKVIYKEELYKAIDWNTVFLLAGLIPLGTAFEQTGAAMLVADAVISVVQSWHVLFILLVIGMITAFFSLFMSNVAATVLLVPLILIMGERFGIDPRGLALLVAVAASNSFILPTHQVNAYIMGTGNYKNSDFLKAGGIMSIIFLLVSSIIVYFFYI